MKRRHVYSACAVLAAILCAAGASALAQQAQYPVKPIRIIVPYAPGGGADVVARVISQKLYATFAQSIIVDNRAGGGGTLGSETAVRATPDGYTLAFVSGAYRCGRWPALPVPRCSARRHRTLAESREGGEHQGLGLNSRRPPTLERCQIQKSSQARRSNLSLLRQLQRVINLDAEVACRAFKCGMPGYSTSGSFYSTMSWF